MARYKVHISGINTTNLRTLSNDELEQKLKLYKEGDASLYDELVEANLRLVLSVVQKFADRYDNLDDLFQIGCIGLIKSIKNFDLSHNVKFSTYAVPMINGEIKRFLRDNSPIKISRQLKDLAYQVLKTKENYLINKQKDATNEEIAAILNVSIRDIEEALESIQPINSIYEPVFEENGEPLFLIDQIKVENDAIFKVADLITLNNGLSQLNSLQKKIINDRYYLDKTQAEIASEFHISQAQVSRLEKSAIEVLRRYF